MTTHAISNSGNTLSRDEIQELYLSLAQELWSIFYAKCNDYTVADDVLSEAFTRLLAHCGGHIRNPRTWLIHVGKNLIIDHLRREKKWSRSPISNADLSTRQTTPEQELLHHEVRALVRESLRDIPPDHRLLLVLRYGLGYSTRRISWLMEKSVEAADMQISRARRKLADAVKARVRRHTGDPVLQGASGYPLLTAG